MSLLKQNTKLNFYRFLEFLKGMSRELIRSTLRAGVWGLRFRILRFRL